MHENKCTHLVWVWGVREGGRSGRRGREEREERERREEYVSVAKGRELGKQVDMLKIT